MLGQPLSMLIPEVIGFKLSGKLREGVTATDLVLTVTQMLRKKGVVNKFVEFYGPGSRICRWKDRATIANMAPEYGATCGFFPIDAETIRYLRSTGGRRRASIWSKPMREEQGLFRTAKSEDPVFTDTLSLDLATVEPRSQDPSVRRTAWRWAAWPRTSWPRSKPTGKKADDKTRKVKVEGTDYEIGHGAVVLAAITSCTNTSNPYVMMAAGLLARNAVARD